MRKILCFLALLVVAEPVHACGRDVLVFDAWWCHVCKRAKQYLDDRGVSYRTIQVTDNPNHWNHVLKRNFGFTWLPITIVNGDWDGIVLRSSRKVIIGFNEAELRESICLH